MERNKIKIEKFGSKDKMKVMQKFRWNIISTNEVYNDETGLKELIIDLERDTNIPNYERIAKLENEYYILPVSYPKLFPLAGFLKEAWFWVIVFFPIILVYWVYNYFAKFQPIANKVNQNIKRRNEILTEMETL